jgi:hypothetical protein
MTDLPVAPVGLRPGQVSILLLGRVAIGDIAVTFVDVALRGLLAVEPTDGDDWLLTPQASAVEDNEVLDYEWGLLTGLTHAAPPVCRHWSRDSAGTWTRRGPSSSEPPSITTGSTACVTTSGPPLAMNSAPGPRDPAGPAPGDDGTGPGHRGRPAAPGRPALRARKG